MKITYDGVAGRSSENPRSLHQALVAHATERALQLITPTEVLP